MLLWSWQPGSLPGPIVFFASCSALTSHSVPSGHGRSLWPQGCCMYKASAVPLKPSEGQGECQGGPAPGDGPAWTWDPEGS